MACLSSDIGYLYNGTPTSAVVFHTVKGDLVASLSQTLCMNGVLQKLKSKIQGGASAPPCTCLRAPLLSVCLPVGCLVHACLSLACYLLSGREKYFMWTKFEIDGMHGDYRKGAENKHRA